MNNDNSIQNWIDAKELFEKLIDQPIAYSLHQVKANKDISGAVKSILINLIESQSSDNTIIDRANLSFFNAIKNMNEDLSGESIGNYQLLTRIGLGGMSNVYKAKRKGSKIQKFIALKLLTSVEGELSDTLKILFEREQITLSKLSHPNIISFHHGGITENGIPFLVMDYIEKALPINQYVIENKLSNIEIIRLIKNVANAINYAHQNLVIHKDIKPSNILIDQLGIPKVVDFGIASFEQVGYESKKSLTAQIFTPDYASPEQIKNETITANSDVFSLAALLLALLSQKKPLPNFNSDQFEAHRYIKHIKAVIINANITTDLNCIISKGMNIDVKLRYQSMSSFEDDLDAFLKIKPVSAHRQTKIYFISKYTKRNPGLSLAIMAFIISAIIGVYATVQQKNKAQLEALKAQQVTDFLFESIQNNDPDISKGKEISVKELLLNAKIKIQETSFQDQQLLTALEQTIGSALAKIGQYGDAEKLLKQAISSHSNNFGARISLALLYLKQQYFEEAESQLEFLMTHTESLSSIQHILVAQIEANLLYKQGDFNAAIETINHSINLTTNNQTIDEKQLINSKLILAKILNENGQPHKSIEILNDALILSNKKFTQVSTTSTNISFSIANAYTALDPIPWDKLHEIFIKTIKNQKIIYGKNHPVIAKTYLQYGFALRIFGDVQKASDYAHLARDIAIINFGENHMLTAHVDLLISQLSLLNNDVAAAIRQLKNVLKIYEAHYGASHYETNQTKTTLAAYYIKAGKGKEALHMLLPLYELQKQQFGENNKATIYVKMNILKSYNLSEKYQFAIDEGIKSLSSSQINLGKEHILTIGIQMTLADSYFLNQDFQKTIQLCNNLLSIGLIKNNSRYNQKVTNLLNSALVNIQEYNQQ
ncbi:MAG: protein kinase [Alcanivoracaceae bacterium]|nr:protein kinase [Alcanivoracaceae bacterium]